MRKKIRTLTFALTLSISFLMSHVTLAQTEKVASQLKSNGLFGSVEFNVGSINALPKWKDTLDKIQIEQEIILKCEQNLEKCLNVPLKKWRDFIKKSRNLPLKETLTKVNAFINEWPYKEDRDNWLRSDYWASPTEFLDKSGDCEDYAIIKYVTLKELGFDTHKMRIVVVMDKLRLLNHAILVVYDNNSQPLVLDSLFDVVLPHSKVLQYTPHYSVNEHARWAHIMPMNDEKN
ncbi:MAG: hypothetical protein CMF60_00405 [Magnetococcales bacterium]|nr:hypothetical protein [Magnetococcales bacterium]MEC8066842.1 transglutaminase-like cysteine peptidase [Pseudomonadota bacterium]|tara:strand:- start:33788 stop:34486 length:699 start_codon:yes stop_codon:yes gene_type:complete